MPADVPASFRIVMIGAGNVAWHLAPALEQAGHQMQAVYSRTPEKAAALATRLYRAEPTASLDFSGFEAALFLIAVPDQALPEVLRQTRFPQGSLVAHTSGSQPLPVLKAAGANLKTGVLYPLQTFSKVKPVDFAAIPVCVEGSDEETLQQLKAVALSVSPQVYEMSSADRKALHVAAVFACNFTNHLLGISFDLLRQHHLPANLLHPLILETVQKALSFPPFMVQTGPAVRNDGAILAEHLRFLQTEPGYRRLYEVLSASIWREAEQKE